MLLTPDGKKTGWIRKRLDETPSEPAIPVQGFTATTRVSDDAFSPELRAYQAKVIDKARKRVQMGEPKTE